MVFPYGNVGRMTTFLVQIGSKKGRKWSFSLNKFFFQILLSFTLANNKINISGTWDFGI